MADFKPIESQEALDAIIKERLDRNTKSVTDEVSKKYQGWISPDDAKKSSDKITELEGKLTEKDTQISALTTKNNEYAAASLKQRIAHEKNIPFELADRLTGTTEEEIRKDADTFAQYANNHPQKPTPQFSGEKPTGNAIDAAWSAMSKDISNM